MVAPSPPHPLYCFTLVPLPPIQNLNFYLKGSLVFVSVIGIPEILVIVTRQDGIFYTYRIKLNLMLFRQFGAVCEVLSLTPPLDFSGYFSSRTDTWPVRDRKYPEKSGARFSGLFLSGPGLVSVHDKNNPEKTRTVFWGPLYFLR